MCSHYMVPKQTTLVSLRNHVYGILPMYIVPLVLLSDSYIYIYIIIFADKKKNDNLE